MRAVGLRLGAPYCVHGTHIQGRRQCLPKECLPVSLTAWPNAPEAERPYPGLLRARGRMRRTSCAGIRRNPEIRFHYYGTILDALGQNLRIYGEIGALPAGIVPS